MIVRIFDTAVEPDDVDKARQIFKDQVQPAFEAFEGCQGIELLLGIDEHSRDLIDIAAVSRWQSLEAITGAIKTTEYEAALSELRKLFQETPIVRHFEIAD